MQKQHTFRLTPLSLAVTYAAVLAGSVVLAVGSASAATLAQVNVRFDRMKVGTATTGTVCAKPATVASTEATVKVTFPTGYTVSTTTSNWTVNTTDLAWPAGAAAWPGVNTATNVTGQTVTFPSTDLASGSTLYCFNWTNSAALSIAAGAGASLSGTVATEATGPTAIDSGSFATAAITDDQIVVSATVPQTFSFALSGNTDALGNLSTSAVTSSSPARTATVNTNAKNGWYVWAKDANTGLHSNAATATIASTTPGTNSTLSVGSEGYNMGVTSSQTGGSGTISVATPFVGGETGKGGGLDTTLRTVASSTGTANNAVLTLTNNASIGSTTAAATDYADTITVVGAGLF